MQKKLLLLSLIACTSLLADSETEALKQELQQQKVTTQKLLSRVESLETRTTDSVNTSASFSQNAYLPDIALILNMSAVGRDVKNSDYENYRVPGFINDLNTTDNKAELPFNKNRGVNLNYAEVAMHSVVDPYFDAFAIFHLHPDEFEIEEAYVTTTSLPAGLRVKAGKFRSAFGRINEKHQHSWHFDDQPIIYKALLGPDMISDPGVQLQWVAPTDTYLMAGVDVMQGTNPRSFGDQDPNLIVGYVKSSIDIGDDLSILGGVSLANGKTAAVDGNATVTAIPSYDSDIYGVDLTMRDQLGSYSALTWQSEYLQREKANDSQAGLYTQLVYQYNNNYSTGIRYDVITKNDTGLSDYNALKINTSNLDKVTAMLEYKPFPMSRLRLSYSYDRSKIIDHKRQDINTVMLTLNIAAGAHGAHNY